jgi:hypothetical protein
MVFISFVFCGRVGSDALSVYLCCLLVSPYSPSLIVPVLCAGQKPNRREFSALSALSCLVTRVLVASAAMDDEALSLAAGQLSLLSHRSFDSSRCSSARQMADAPVSLVSSGSRKSEKATLFHSPDRTTTRHSDEFGQSEKARRAADPRGPPNHDALPLLENLRLTCPNTPERAPLLGEVPKTKSYMSFMGQFETGCVAMEDEALHNLVVNAPLAKTLLLVDESIEEHTTENFKV